MKCKIQGFLNANHSWSIVNQNIGRKLISLGHEVHFVPTDEGKCFPDDLKPYLKTKIENKNFDFQLSYTAMINFSTYLSYGNKNRFGIWCFEFRGAIDEKTGKRLPALPNGFAKYYQYADKILAPTKFTKDIFVEALVPENKIEIVPHGLNLEEFSTTTKKYPLKAKAKKYILANIAQIHTRKNLPGLLEVYGKAFNRTDDVCLVLKVSIKPIKHSFELSFDDVFKDWLKKYPNHAKVEIIKEFIPNIVELYNACDIVFTMSHCEGWYLPGSEGFAASKICIAPNYGGQLDFMNENNSILVNGKEGPAGRNSQYWQSSPYSVMFFPDIEEAVEKLRYVVNNYDSLLDKFLPNMQNIVQNLSWENIVKNRILPLCK